MKTKPKTNRFKKKKFLIQQERHSILYANIVNMDVGKN